jgi:D-arabinose 1-dehydrogenase-like Zn-dependent alcohol dehydrogenase
MGAYSRGEGNRRVLESVHDEIMKLLGSRRLTPLVSAHVGLDDVAATLERLRDRQVIGRSVTCPDA